MTAPRLDVVSPLPPVRSGIADYTLDLLPHLAERCDVRLMRLPGQPLADDVAERWRPVDAAETGVDGRLPLYQMGNNRHHAEVLRLALERPGVLTLHDLVLHHLVVETTLAGERFDAYRERLAADHGWIGELAATARRWGELGSAALFELPVHRTLVRRQRGVLVHSRWAAERLREECGEVAVEAVPMGVPLPEPVPAGAVREFRRRRGLDEVPLLVGSFGFQTPIKRAEVAIRALAQPELEAARLLIVGQVSPSLDLEGLARELGVAERVHLEGFLDYREFETAIAACDLCLNLRYPTAGETSASLLRVMAVGKAVAVSDYAQFAELSDEVALKVPLGEGEVEGLAASLAEAAERPQRLAAMGEAARARVAERHDPARAAERVIEACEALAEREPPGDQAPRVPRPTTLTWLELGGALEVAGAETPWPAGEARRLEAKLTNGGFGRWLATRHEPCGVLVEIQWRRGPEDPPMEQLWVELPRDLAPGESFRFEREVRRPEGSGQLVVEPHVKGVSGFGKLGGPTWVGDVG